MPVRVAGGGVAVADFDGDADAFASARSGMETQLRRSAMRSREKLGIGANGDPVGFRMDV